MAVLKVDEAIEAAAKPGQQAEALQRFATLIWNAWKLDDFAQHKSEVEIERPFIRPLTCALFTAYRHAAAIPLAQLGALRTGAGREMLLPTEEILAPIKKAMPTYSDFLDKRGTSVLHYVLDALEEKLLAQLSSDLTEQSTDEQSIQLAQEILKEVDRVQADKTKVEPPAGFTAPTN
jgi:hypothetical protein